MFELILKWLGLANSKPKVKREKYTRITPELEETVMEYYNNGVEVKNIVDIVPLSKTSVYRIIKRKKIEI